MDGTMSPFRSAGFAHNRYAFLIGTDAVFRHNECSAEPLRRLPHYPAGVPPMVRWVLSLAMLLGCLVVDQPLFAEDPPHWREPIALAWSADGKQVFTANQKSGTVSVIDTRDWKTTGECAVAKHLADLALVP